MGDDMIYEPDKGSCPARGIPTQTHHQGRNCLLGALFAPFQLNCWTRLYFGEPLSELGSRALQASARMRLDHRQTGCPYIKRKRKREAF